MCNYLSFILKIIFGKDVIILNILRNLIENSSDNLDGIIDLSNTSTNKIENFQVKRNFVEVLDKNDFKVVKKFINSKKLIHCDFEFNSLQEIGEDTFLELNEIKKMTLQVDYLCLFKERCFNGLNSLETLFIEGMGNASFSTRFLFGLSNLICLEICYSSILKLEKENFDSLPNLNYLKLYSNDIKTIDNSVFSGMRKLNIIELNKNKINSFNKQAFFNMINLEYLCFENFVENSKFNTSYLNRMENLKCLIISNWQNSLINEVCLDNLPNLKFLSVNSNTIPASKNKLIFLEVKSVDQLYNCSFRNFNGLKGLVLKLKKSIIKNINNLRIENLKSIEYFSIEYEDEVERFSKHDFERIFGLQKLQFLKNRQDVSIVNKFISLILWF